MISSDGPGMTASCNVRLFVDYHHYRAAHSWCVENLFALYAMLIPCESSNAIYLHHDQVWVLQ